jgi:hypothetical protein
MDERTLLLYRRMAASSGQTPLIGQSARMLGARPAIDIPVDAEGWVRPDTGGMSVAPHDPRNLPRHRLPPEFGGTGKDPVWSIRASDLGPDLQYRPDPSNPTGHGFVEPARPMSFDEYQHALAEMQPLWRRHHPA